MASSRLSTLLGFLTAVASISIDMYLPAFPAIQAALGGGAGAAQFTLAAFFLGLAAGQMTQGPLSDRLGRRVPLIAGMAVYTLASIGCALAPGLLLFSGFRALAAFAGSAGMVVPRAIVRDLADGHEAAVLFARLMLVMGASPILAPMLGGFVLEFAGWHAIFWICAAYGALCLGLVWRYLPDTLPPARRLTIGFAGILARYVTIGGERGFITHALTGACATFALFAYIGGASPVFIERFHVLPQWFGLIFGVCAMSYIGASQVNARLLPLWGSERLLRRAALAMLGGTLGLLLAGLTDIGGLWGILAPLMVVQGALGLILPTATVGALSRHAAHAGSASALIGTLQFGSGAVSGALVGLAADGTARPMAVLMLLGALGAVALGPARARAAGVGPRPVEPRQA